MTQKKIAYYKKLYADCSKMWDEAEVLRCQAAQLKRQADILSERAYSLSKSAAVRWHEATTKTMAKIERG